MAFTSLLTALIPIMVACAMGILILGIVVLFIKAKSFRGLCKWISHHSAYITLVVSFAATVCSLVYSEVLGFEPCTLCWWQRIAMYPLVVISAFSLRKSTYQIRNIIMTLSGAGLIIAAYHYILQLTKTSGMCLIGAVDCATVQVNSFGFLSIPLMAAVAFAIIFLVQFYRK